MGFCGLMESAAMFDVTPVENMFLLEYLPSSPDGFLRVYLYGRMLCLHPELGDSVERMADALRMTKEEVLNAFDYWEQQGLVEKQTDNPPTYTFRILNAGAHAAQDDMERDYYRYRWFNSSMQEVFGSEHLLQPKQYAMANDWLNVLGFEQDAALCLLEYEYKKGKSKDPAAVFRRADKRAVAWAEKGIHTLAEVEEAISYDDRTAKVADRVLKQLSVRRAPTVDELNTVRRWLDEWKLTEEDIIAGCARTTASRTPSIAYLDAILKPGEITDSNDFEAVKEILRELGTIGSMPTPDQCRTYADLINDGFEKETLLLAAVQCARKGKHRFDDLLWMVQKWSDAGVRTFRDAEKYLEDMNRMRSEAHEVLKTAGLSRRPGADDIARYMTWKSAYSKELILYAAELANGTRVPVQYMTKLLGTWADTGVRTVNDARSMQSKNQASAGRTASEAMNYQQHTYTEEDFNDEFYYDPKRDFLQGDDKK